MTIIKQESALLFRFLVAAKSRSDFVIKEAIGDFEFNVVSPSNFHPDGPMIMQSDKAQVVFSNIQYATVRWLSH